MVYTSFPMVLFSSNKKFNCSGIPSILKPKSLRFLAVTKEWKIHRHVLLSTWCHAHCLFDSVFAALKKLYRRSYVDSLDQLEMVVNCSSISCPVYLINLNRVHYIVNHCVWLCIRIRRIKCLSVCSSTTNTTVRYLRWEWRDWQTFLAQVFRPLPCINDVHISNYIYHLYIYIKPI